MVKQIRDVLTKAVHSAENYCNLQRLDYAFIVWLPNGNFDVFATQESIPSKSNTKFWRVTLNDCKTRTGALINELMQSLGLIVYA